MTSRRSPLARVCALLFFSGACALTYEVAWQRELRLIFGASTGASAAVLAVFLGGLGVGGAVLGKRADRSPNPLRLYAHLEIGVAVVAAITPLLVRIAERAYLGIGGSSALGPVGATAVRLLLSVLVLGPSTFLMGGTLPAAARAVEREADVDRRNLAALYASNTFGAVAGSLLASFLFLEVFGTQLTQWIVALVNVLVGMIARGMSSDAATGVTKSDDERAEPDERNPMTAVSWFPPAAAAISGATFLVMELVWYRMLGPILGGSSYTFGLILAVALAGIAIGGLLYARARAAPSLRLFALTCALEALFVAIPYALGDRLALLALFLRPLVKTGFAASVGVWTVVAAIVVLPAAIVSGFQFPVVIGLYGRGPNRVGRDVGHAYFANTLGSIVGSIAGGFGLMPALSAPGCWRLVVYVLAATAAASLVLDARVVAGARRLALFPAVVAGCALAALFADGPSAVWRHSGIGAGRADGYLQDPAGITAFERETRGTTVWEEDGRESSVALSRLTGFTFIVNGKADGHAVVDAPTQVMGGLLGAILHDDAHRALVIGLGTGSTAGWLAEVPSMEHVDVVELEPAVLRVAKDCAPVNANVLAHPKVTTRIGDAREALLTSSDRYDIIFSEPSNPYRAGIASLYTAEYYRAAAARLREGGMFIQWTQAYEVDAWAIATVATTLSEVFGSITIWETMPGDLVFIARKAPLVVDVDRMRARLAVEPFRTAARSTWHTTSAEGVLAHFLGGPALTRFIVEKGVGVVNRDDQNFLEFAFARSVGRKHRVDRDLAELARRLGADVPDTSGRIDPDARTVEGWSRDANARRPLESGPAALGATATALEQLSSGTFITGLRSWKKLGRAPLSYYERQLAVRAAAASADPSFDDLAAGIENVAERDLLRGIFLSHGDPSHWPNAVDALERGLLALRKDPWVLPDVVSDALRRVTALIGPLPVDGIRRLAAATSEPFAVELLRSERLEAHLRLARSLGPDECLRALERFGFTPWTREVLETRALCTQVASHPSAGAAAGELARFVASENRLSDLAPPQAPSAPPAPAAPVDDGKDRDAGTDGARDAASAR